MIMVRKFTPEIIKHTFQAYAQGSRYWLKFYAANFDTKTLDLLRESYTQKDKFLESLIAKKRID